jgi:hypothetical protein
MIWLEIVYPDEEHGFIGPQIIGNVDESYPWSRGPVTPDF